MFDWGTKCPHIFVQYNHGFDITFIVITDFGCRSGLGSVRPADYIKKSSFIIKITLQSLYFHSLTAELTELNTPAVDQSNQNQS